MINSSHLLVTFKISLVSLNSKILIIIFRKHKIYGGFAVERVNVKSELSLKNIKENLIFFRISSLSIAKFPYLNVLFEITNFELH